MLDLIKLIRDEMLANPNIVSYVGDRIVMSDKPVGNTIGDYPQITMDGEDGPTDSLTDDYFPDLRIHIWTRGDARKTIAGQIAREILIQIDKKSYLTNDPIVYQMWKSNNIGVFEDETQTYHRTLSFDVVMEGHGGNL